MINTNYNRFNHRSGSARLSKYSTIRSMNSDRRNALRKAASTVIKALNDDKIYEFLKAVYNNNPNKVKQLIEDGGVNIIKKILLAVQF